MKFYKINTHEAEALFYTLGCDKTGAKIMSKKTDMHLLLIKQMHVGAANILKQDALSIGADLAVPNGVVVAKEKYVDAVLMGTTKHFEILAKKELAQPFGLKNLAKELTHFIKHHHRPIKIMGVLNANDDSFFAASRFDGASAYARIEAMIEEGADIIDIGAVSSRPGSQSVSAEIEMGRLGDILELIYTQKLYEKVVFSIDSYEPQVIQKALDCGFSIVNDITGLTNPLVAQIAGQYQVSVVIMHMLGTPQTMQDNPRYDDVMCEVDDFFKERIALAHEAGVHDIILDVGIGFGKTLAHNLTLLQNLEHFCHFGYEVLIGASRKSMIDLIVPSATSERLAGTLAIHLDAINKGASIVRCHDVKEHFQAIKVQEALKNTIFS